MSTRRSLLFILSALLCSYIIMIIVFPDLFLSHTVSFIRFGDTEHNYYGVFTLVSNFFHGGIQLWNPYDQMPLAYYYLTGGLTSFSNLVTGALYILLSPFFASPSSAFHTVYSLFYYVPAMGILTSGYFLLLQRFVRSSVLLFLMMVLGSSLYIPQIFLGLNSGSIYSFFPLLAHFILSFFEGGGLQYLFLSFLTLIVCIAMNAQTALGYFYLGVHFFLLSCLGWYIGVHRKHLFFAFRAKNVQLHSKSIKYALLTLFLSFLLLAPFVYMMKTNYKDYEFTHATSRFANINPLNISLYFQRDTQYAPQEEFFSRMLNFEKNRWEGSWLFLGFSALFLSVVGIVYARDARVLIFGATVFFYWAINSTRTLSGPSAIAHVLNALTNPLNFVVRSFHMTGAFMLPFVFVPLIGAGLQSLADGNNTKRLGWIKLGGTVAVLLIIAFSVFPSLSLFARFALVFSLLIAVLLLVLLQIPRLSSQLRLMLILEMCFVIFVIDAREMYQYLRTIAQQMYVSDLHTVPTASGSFLLDYQNPNVLPLRRRFVKINIPKMKGYLYIDPNNMQGLFYRYTNLFKFFYPASIYTPRHRSYAALSTDRKLQQYIQAREELIARGDGNGEVIPSQSGRMEKFSFNVHEAKKNKEHDLILYTLSLPDEFPDYLTSSIFVDEELTATIADHTLFPVQGKPTKPFTFDVQNVATHILTIALPEEMQSNLLGSLTYPAGLTRNITRVYKYAPDALGFIYETEQDGWIVFHYPFDPKWHIRVDGISTPVSRMNKSFLGIPIGKGSHDVLVEYWPGTLLRPALGVAMILILVLPFVIIGIGIKEQWKKV